MHVLDCGLCLGQVRRVAVRVNQDAVDARQPIGLSPEPLNQEFEGNPQLRVGPAWIVALIVHERHLRVHPQAAACGAAYGLPVHPVLAEAIKGNEVAQRRDLAHAIGTHARCREVERPVAEEHLGRETRLEQRAGRKPIQVWRHQSEGVNVGEGLE